MSVALCDQKAQTHDVVCACVCAVTASPCSSLWLSRKIIQRCVSTVGISAAGGLQHCPVAPLDPSLFNFCACRCELMGQQPHCRTDSLISTCILTCSQCWPGLPGSPEPPAPTLLLREPLPPRAGLCRPTDPLLLGHFTCSSPGPAWSMQPIRHLDWLQVLQHELMGLCDQRPLPWGWHCCHSSLWVLAPQTRGPFDLQGCSICWHTEHVHEPWMESLFPR